MKILVTGYAGYIGPILTKILHSDGHEVVGFDTNFFKDQIEKCDPEYIPDHEYFGDIRNINDSVFKNMDAVIHLAGLSNDPMGDIAAEQTISINGEGTKICAQKAKKAGIDKFIFASSCSMYGASGNTENPLDEHAPLAPVSAYAKSKVYGENALIEITDDGFRPYLLRNATAYGISPRMRLDLVLGNLMAHGYASKTIKVLSDGTPWRPMVHIEDMSLAMLAIINNDHSSLKHQVYNVGNANSNYTVKEIAEIAQENLNNCNIEITSETGNDPRSYKVNFDRILTELPGYKPKWNLNLGAKETARWLMSNKSDINYLLGEKYIRLLQLKKLRDTSLIDSSFQWIP